MIFEFFFIKIPGTIYNYNEINLSATLKFKFRISLFIQEGGFWIGTRGFRAQLTGSQCRTQTLQISSRRLSVSHWPDYTDRHTQP